MVVKKQIKNFRPKLNYDQPKIKNKQIKNYK